MSYKEEIKQILKIKAATKKETLENLSLVVMIGSTALVMIGLGAGSFIPYTYLLAAVGAFLLLPGICIYIASQLIEDYEKPAESAEHSTELSQQ